MGKSDLQINHEMHGTCLTGDTHKCHVPYTPIRYCHENKAVNHDR